MLGFFIAIGAGFITPQITQSVVPTVIKAVSGKLPIDATEAPVIGFMLALLAASVAAVLLQSGSPFWIVLGCIIGYFGLRIVAAAQGLVKKKT